MIVNNTSKAVFENVKTVINNAYSILSKDNIKAIFIKKLPNADVLPQNKLVTSGGNTTHIACTTNSRNFFYPILGDIAFNEGLNDESTFDIYVEKKYTNNESDSMFIKSKCTIWNFPKLDTNQIGLSKQSSDGVEFFQLRRNMYPGDFLIFFKYLENDLLRNCVILLKHDDENDRKSIDIIVESKDPLSFAKYYEELVDQFSYDYHSKGINKIYYGAPGTGKSKHVDDVYYDEFAKRVTFHPEYTYNDFIGYIRPVNKQNEDGVEELTYEFVAGTFTEILIEALDDPSNMYSLIIEEINRANTSAVFGDLFQLLDRDSYGFSEYRVNNPEIYNYIKKELKREYLLNDGSIYIPNNLNIIATMNTADQNVFAMDTAFKRRWQFEYIPVEFKEDHSFKNDVISGLDITWIEFVNTINEFMMSEENSTLMISEDKQIGQYFVKQEELLDPNKFGYKVLLYLWDDVFKMDKSSMFNNDIRTFSDLMNSFSTGTRDDKLNIFSSIIKEKLK